MRRRLLVGALTPLVFWACGSPDEEYDADLSELGGELAVRVNVLGTRDPVQARRIVVELVPGPTATLAHDALCPIVHAGGSVNALPLSLTSPGKWTGSECKDIWFERPLETDLPSDLLKPLLRVEIGDQSGTVVVEGDNFLEAPTASIVSPPDGRMVPGGRVEFRVSPSSLLLPREIDIYYHADDPTLSFGMQFVEATAEGFAVQVAQTAKASSGQITIEGRGDNNPFGVTPSRCDGARQCTIERGLCSDTAECRSGIARGPGFDVLTVAASVVEPPP